MRSALLTAAITLALTGCIDFELEDRRFRCVDDPEICGQGSVCNEYGFCAPPGDASPAAKDADQERPDAQLCTPGERQCDDGNLCTISRCSSEGNECEHTPRRCEPESFQCCPSDGICRAQC